MEHHQDYLKRQIDQAARVLGKILADLTGLKNQGKIGEGIEMANAALKQEFDIDIGRLSEIPTDTFIDTVINNNALHTANFEKFADVLFELAHGYDQQGQKEDAKGIYTKILAIYEHLNASGNTFSFDRHFKEKKIKNLLQN